MENRKLRYSLVLWISNVITSYSIHYTKLYDGPKLYKKTIYDKLGNPTGEEFIDENGNPVGSDGSYQMQAPQSAIDALEKDPKLAEQFKQKYGYLPPGF